MGRYQSWWTSPKRVFYRHFAKDSPFLSDSGRSGTAQKTNTSRRPWSSCLQTSAEKHIHEASSKYQWRFWTSGIGENTSSSPEIYPRHEFHHLWEYLGPLNHLRNQARMNVSFDSPFMEISSKFKGCNLTVGSSFGNRWLLLICFCHRCMSLEVVQWIIKCILKNI